MGATSVVRPRVRRGLGAWLRKADEVCVYSLGIGYVRCPKGEARRILRRLGDRVTVEWIPELGLLFINPATF